MRIKPRWVSIWALVIWASAGMTGVAHAAPPAPLVLGDIASKISLEDHVEIYRDGSRSLSIDDVSSRPNDAGAQGFLPASKEALRVGYTDDAVWLRFSVKNEVEKSRSLRLILTTMQLWNVDFYTRAVSCGNCVWKHSQAGSMIPASQHPQRISIPATALELAKGQTEEVYVRVTSPTAISITPFVTTGEVFAQRGLLRFLIVGLILGGLFSLAIYSLALSVLTRSMVFFWQAVGFAVLTFYEACTRGIAKYYLWPESTLWASKASSIFLSIYAIVFTLYVYTAVRSQVETKTLQFTALAFISVQLLVLLGLVFGDFLIFSVLSNIFAPASVAILMVLVFTRFNFRGITPPLSLAIFLVSLAASSSQVHSLVMDAFGVTDSLGWEHAPSVLILALGLLALANWFARTDEERRKSVEELLNVETRHRKRLQSEVKTQTLKLRDALAQATSAFQKQSAVMAYISHDLRTPAATIVSYIRSIRDSASSGSKTHLDSIERIAQYELSLIGELMSYGGSDNEVLHLDKDEVSLTDFLEEIELCAKALIAHDKNSFSLVRGRDLPAVVVVDGKRLRQVLLNLLSNATKCTTHGYVYLEVQATLFDKACVLFFKVSDTGRGLSTQVHKDLVQRLKQPMASIESPGLGLRIVRKIVELMGGDFKFGNGANGGAEFTFTVPAQLPSRGSPDDPAHERSLGKHSVVQNLINSGRYSEIEEWLGRAKSEYPQYGALYPLMEVALHRLDFGELSRLASLGPKDWWHATVAQ